MEEIIHYADIPKFSDSAVRGKRYSILLSKFQAKLYRKKIEHDLNPQKNKVAFIDTVLYSSNLIAMVLFSRNLLYLAYFHDFDPKSLRAIEFKESRKNVLLVINATETSNSG